MLLRITFQAIPLILSQSKGIYRYEMDAEETPRKGSAISSSTTITSSSAEDLPSPKSNPVGTASFRSTDATVTIVELWSEAVARYRHSFTSTDNTQPLFLDQTVTVTDHFQAAFDQWSQFRSGSKSRSKVGRIIQILQDKISTMDVLIGYPTQAVIVYLIQRTDI